VVFQPISAWDRSTLQDLINRGVEEDDRLDYKRSLNLETPRGRAEAAKDVSSLANTFGGRIVIGLVEEEREGLNVPVAFEPFSDPGLKDRLVDVLYSLCVPNVHVDPKLIEVADGYCMVMEIPESLAPVFVTARGHNRYYKRYDSKSVPMHERDVQARYQRLLTARTSSEAMMEEAQIVSGWPIGERPRPPWLSLVAVPAYGPVDIFNPAVFQRPAPADLLHERRTGVWDTLTTYRPTYFGLELSMGREPHWKTLLRLHRTGVIEYHHAVEDASQDWVSASSGEPDPPSLDLTRQRHRLREVVDIIEGLYRAGGYLSDLYLWGEYRIPGGWSLGSLKLYAPQPLYYDEWVSVAHLEQRQEAFVESLLDRLAQSAGLWSSREV